MEIRHLEHDEGEESEVARHLWIPASGFRVSSFGFRVPGFGFWVPGFGFRVSGSGFRFSVFGFWVPGFGFRVWVPSALRGGLERVVYLPEVPCAMIEGLRIRG